ncbi:hypothetical protein [Ferruginibacter sp.]|uniref:hypothetical protein n=1 Tax=Ferruginibacter sp. TaxID=1940288 RepID=UPI001988D273|nr:hypothetical protein [Ferruginibacter sp.]MBC7626322.1 hypothetical protein [Ferruginibacter sp.]
MIRIIIQKQKEKMVNEEKALRLSGMFYGEHGYCTAGKIGGQRMLHRYYSKMQKGNQSYNQLK